MCGGLTSPTHYIKILKKKMDKKMYFEPETEVIDLKLTNMLCASPGDIDEETGESPFDPDGKD